MVPKSIKPLQLPFPPGYDLKVKYEYHDISVGHSIKDYREFEAKVQNLINNKSIVFEEDNSNVKCEYHIRTVGHAI